MKGTVKMIDPKFMTALVQLGADEKEHSHRSFRDHLKGTHDLLESWGNPIEVCLAGLFHSIYGTVIFKNQTVEISNRSVIQNLIGEEAEELAYLFCACDSKRLLDNCVRQS